MTNKERSSSHFPLTCRAGVKAFLFVPELPATLIFLSEEKHQDKSRTQARDEGHERPSRSSRPDGKRELLTLVEES